MATTAKSVKSTKAAAAKKTDAGKKPAAKSAAKKPAAKKPAAKAPAAKKPAVKKPAVKTTAARKPAAKTAVKKPAAKTTAASKPAAKTAVKKTAAKPAAAKKPAVKPAVPQSAAKPAVKPVVSKPALTVKPAPHPAPAKLDPSVKVLNLFEAYAQDKLPRDQGYIVSSFFKETSAYSIYEIVSYSGVKEIMNLGTGLQFTTTSKKIHILVEPPTYNFKHVEPVNRQEGDKIPYRESELDIIKAIDQTRIMIAKSPLEVPTSFTVLRPSGINFSVIFYNLPDIYQSLRAFFKYSLNQERRIPQRDAEKAADLVALTVEKTMGFQGDFA